MSIDIRDIKLQQSEQLKIKEDKPKRFPAKLIAVDGSVIPNNRPNSVYFREFGNEEAAVGIAINYATKKQAGLSVWVQEHPSAKGILTVTGLYTDDSNPSTTTNMSSLGIGSHAESHEYESETVYGDDVVRVFQPAIQPFKLTASGLDYTLQPYIYVYKQVRFLFPGYRDTLLASSAGKVRHVVVYLNLTDNLSYTVDGAEVLNNGVIPIPVPQPPTNKSVISGYLKIDDTSIVEWIDARGLINLDNYDLEPRQENDILIAYSGEFVSRRPIVDSFGNIITDSEGSIVTV